MTHPDALEFLLFTFLLLSLTPILGTYMAHVFMGKKTWATAPFEWLEKLCYKTASIDPKVEMDATTYIKSLCFFNFFGFLTVFILMLTQGFLPFNPENFGATSPHLAFNTAISFMTNTNWQSYVPERTLSYFTQVVGLTVQNFLSPATSLSVLVVLIRGLIGKQIKTIGNFWVDATRAVVYILLPLSIILAVILLTQGTIQSFSPYVTVTTLEGQNQIIPLGPVASQTAIKQIGSNGGGFFNANSAHPFENPTALSNFLETLCILLVPSACIYFYGVMIGMKKHGWLIYSVIFLFFLLGFFLSLYGEHVYGQNMGFSPVLEGKEVRFGLSNSILWTALTTSTSNGSVNSVLSSLSPLSQAVALFNIMLDELIFGGAGVGLCSMIIFILLTVFISGLMVGRTPEYMGKKIETREILWISVAILTPATLILMGTGISAVLPLAVTNLRELGPHGLSTILYAFTSTAGNNGSAFAALNSNTPYYNIFLGVVMLLGRFALLIACVKLAGLLGKKNISPLSIGTFSTNTKFFASLLFTVILLVGALTFFPVLALGPVIEHYLMLENRFF